MQAALDALRAELAAERAARAALEARIAVWQAALDALTAKPLGKVVWLKQEAADLGLDPETLRRRILHDPQWRKIGGKWCRPRGMED